MQLFLTSGRVDTENKIQLGENIIGDVCLSYCLFQFLRQITEVGGVAHLVCPRAGQVHRQIQLDPAGSLGQHQDTVSQEELLFNGVRHHQDRLLTALPDGREFAPHVLPGQSIQRAKGLVE